MSAVLAELDVKEMHYWEAVPTASVLQVSVLLNDDMHSNQ